MCKGHTFGRNGFLHRPMQTSLSAETHKQFARQRVFRPTWLWAKMLSVSVLPHNGLHHTLTDRNVGSTWVAHSCLQTANSFRDPLTLFNLEKFRDFRIYTYKKTASVTDWFFCDTVGIQTLNLLIRSQMLYSVELRCHIFCNCECKGSVLFYSRQGFALFFAKTTSKKVKDDRMTLLPRPFWAQNGCYDHWVQMALGWKYTKKAY